MSDKFFVGLDLTSLEDNGTQRPISRVTLKVDDENVLTAGDDTGLELIADCPHATQTMVNTILAQVKGYKYQMFSAGDTSLDPAAELGDGITVGGIYSAISRIDDDGNGYPSVTAPGEAELEDEYPSAGPMTREFNRQLAQTRSSITKTAEQIRLEVENELRGMSASIDVQLESITSTVKGAQGDISTLKQTVGSLSLSVSNGQTTSTLTLKAGSATLSSGTIELKGLVTFSDLSGSGKTTISGDNITTGKISAKYIAVDELKVEKLYGSYSRLAIYSDGGTLNIGTDGTTTGDYNYVNLFARQRVEIGSYNGNANLIIDNFNSQVYPESSTWDLGTSSHYWREAHIKKLYLSDSCYITAGDAASIKVGTSTISADSDVSELKNGSNYVSLTSTGHLNPRTSSGYYLGSSSYYWEEAYIKEIHFSSSCYVAGSGSALVPGSNNYSDLGSSGKYWRYIYTQRLYLMYSSYQNIYLSANSSGKLCVNGTAIH